MPGRNEPCPCGSGKKYKRCCLPGEEEREAERRRPKPSSPTGVPGARIGNRGHQVAAIALIAAAIGGSGGRLR